jgi:hypothetical protein
MTKGSYWLDNHTITHSSNIDACNYHFNSTSMHYPIVIKRHVIHPKQYNFNWLKPRFGFITVVYIQHTIANRSQLARMDTRLPIRKHFKTRFPATNLSRRNDTVAMTPLCPTLLFMRMVSWVMAVQLCCISIADAKVYLLTGKL